MAGGFSSGKKNKQNAAARNERAIRSTAKGSGGNQATQYAQGSQSRKRRTAQGGSASSDDEECPGQRNSARQLSQVDLSRLEASSLRKYRRVYKLGDMASGLTKEDLVAAVSNHWQTQVVEEQETLLAFAMTLRQQYVSEQPEGMGGTGSVELRPTRAQRSTSRTRVHQ
mmetsp:Transcript_18817/g.41183  ORF Transcript_18817/g.41183 Transcript_18817/m.41183 type:complete len:169 (-) Transcript_18817:277-783(-)|eukprot:CAMPEP_0118923872 /NCGR_PEP_ID=MMETSP1169-20130426/2246_1 /TAXON_ID=36882 /ORGANISM="Pyramimonas obovata, Strain CCMP722" /LENGTH=168 /DNA_ID=CAMNT_0006864927 /DNA_START=243 /DNA_END=749 /DNA_ORIENTATION=+